MIDITTGLVDLRGECPCQNPSSNHDKPTSGPSFSRLHWYLSGLVPGPEDHTYSKKKAGPSDIIHDYCVFFTQKIKHKYGHSWNLLRLSTWPLLLTFVSPHWFAVVWLVVQWWSFPDLWTVSIVSMLWLHPFLGVHPNVSVESCHTSLNLLPANHSLRVMIRPCALMSHGLALAWLALRDWPGNSWLGLLLRVGSHKKISLMTSSWYLDVCKMFW